MAFPNGYVKQTLLFNLPQGEVATCTFGWDSGGMGALSSAAADAFATRAGSLWDLIDFAFADTVSYNGSRIAKYDSAGVLQTTYERIVTPGPGTSTADTLPTEVAVCASLRTDLAGRRTRGRVFLPCPAVTSMTPEGRFRLDVAPSIADALAGYLAGFSADGNPMTSVVVSKTGQLLTPITSVSIGDVFDVQRRRRDALLEARVDSPVT